MADTQAGAPSARHRTAWFAVLAVSVLSVVVVGWTVGAPPAGHLLAGLMGAAAAARAFLPPGAVGPLAVRTRTVDVTLTLGMAVLLVAVTQALPD